jgi:hypothetical protein
MCRKTDAHFPGLILMGQISTLKIGPSDNRNKGKKRVLLHGAYRDGAKRHQIVKLTVPSGRFVLLEVIGRDEEDKDLIGLDRDDREHLGVRLGDSIRIDVTKCGLLGTVVWFLTNNDPSIRISAILAVLSVSLGILGVLLSIVLSL